MFEDHIKDRFGDKEKVKNDKILGPGHYPSEYFKSIEYKMG
jgi:hypothetical protein